MLKPTPDLDVIIDRLLTREVTDSVEVARLMAERLAPIWPQIEEIEAKEAEPEPEPEPGPEIDEHGREIVTSSDGRKQIKRQLYSGTYLERYDPPFYQTQPDHAPHLVACEPIPLEKCPMKHHEVFVKFREQLEQNQLVDACCRHPEHHLVGAYWSDEEEKAGHNKPPLPNPKGAPNIYIMFCTCGRRHRRFMMGSGSRPMWEIR